MAITPQTIVEAHQSYPSTQQKIYETVDEYVIEDLWEQEGQVEVWQKVFQDFGNPIDFIEIDFRDSFNDSIDISNLNFEDVKGTPFTVRLIKNTNDNIFRCISNRLEDLKNLLQSEYVQEKARIFLINIAFPKFSSRSCTFISFNDAYQGIGQSSATCQAIQARKNIRDLSGDILPSHLGFWLSADISETSPVLELWKELSLQRLLLLPANEVWRANDNIYLALTMGKKREFKMDSDNVKTEDLFPQMSETASWLFDTEREVDIRHTLLTSELKREWPVGCENWSEGLQLVLGDALEGAKHAYKAHLENVTSSVLASFADLRRALNEENTKITDRTRDLISSLYRDLLIGLGAIGIRATLLSSKTSSDINSRVFLGGAAAILFISWLFNRSVNRRFLSLSRKNRQKWHERIQSSLATKDFFDLAKDPLDKADEAYEKQEKRVSIIYMCVIGFLIALAVWPEKAPTESQASSKQETIEKTASAPPKSKKEAPPSSTN